MKLSSAIFYSKDISAIKDFYINFLGLKVAEEFGERFISFEFENGVKLGIKKADKPREVPGHQSIFVEVDNIEEWYKKVQKVKATIYKELIIQDWGTSFSVLDADDNKVEFVKTSSTL